MRDRRPPPEHLQHARLPGLTPRSPSELLMPTRPPIPAGSGRRTLRASSADGELRRPSGFVRFFNGLLTFLLLILILVGGTAFVLNRSFSAPGPLAANTVIVVPKGEGTYEVAGRLEREGVVRDRRLFVAHYLSARLMSGSAADKFGIKAGEYEVKAAASVREVLDTLLDGRIILYRVSVPEGLTSLQIVERLRADQNLSGEISAVPPEGSLLPDTHRVARGTARQELIDRMKADNDRLVAQLWSKRQADLPFRTVQEALIMASIVEKETGRNDERARVAGVFVNRLRKNMRLQSDPTITYGLVGGQGPLGRGLTRSDIDSRTAYNTYQIDGLPPGPICNPGRPALEATLNPAKTQDLYFVADGTGGHTFTTNLKDHNAAVANWRRIEREQREAKARASGTVLPPEPATPPAAAEPTAASQLVAPPPPVVKPAAKPKPPVAKSTTSDPPPQKK